MKNMPNLLSFSRILATILVFILAIVNQPWSFLIATVIFFLASVTDLLDGYLARRYHLVSPLGIFLDLTADKVFVSAILVAFVQISLVPAWIVVIIITREFLVTGLRSVASASGVPYSFYEDSTALMLEQKVATQRDQAPGAMAESVSPDYFRTMRVPLREGRWFHAGELQIRSMSPW